MNTVNNSFSDEISSPDRMRKCLEARVKQLAKEDICLAFSSGVDSSLLLKTAADAAAHMGGRVYAVTFDSRLHPSCDLETARCVVGELGGVHEVVAVDEPDQESIKNNPANCCYLYKHHLFSRLAELTEAKGIKYILDGTNEGDMHIYCPGIRALKELGIINPLAELRITKAQVKVLASEYGISVASYPSTPYMATRLSYDVALDCEALKRIGEGEVYVRTMVPDNVHLKLYRDIVRLELDPEASEVFVKGRREIINRLKKMGFVYITLDVERFRSRSMDTGLNGPGVQQKSKVPIKTEYTNEGQSIINSRSMFLLRVYKEYGTIFVLSASPILSIYR